MHTNCAIWACIEWNRRVAAWKRAGAPVGTEPYLVVRPSRSRPRNVPHFLVGSRDSESDRMHLESFTPETPVDVPWWRACGRLLFRGRVKQGDTPSRH